MKVACKGLNVPQGKVKYNDRIFAELVDKFQPVKLSPYYFNFMSEDYDGAAAIAVTNDSVLDLLIRDIEKIEGRLSRAEDAAEKAVLAKCLSHLEEQKPVCDLALDAGERTFVHAFGLLSYKPTVVLGDASSDADTVGRAILEKAGKMFFYTVGKPEVHAWLIDAGADAVTCAGKIHSDLARGFIKAEIVSCSDMMTAHNMQDARTKGLTKLVDRDYVIPQNTILDIRFNV